MTDEREPHGFENIVVTPMAKEFIIHTSMFYKLNFHSKIIY